MVRPGRGRHDPHRPGGGSIGGHGTGDVGESLPLVVDDMLISGTNAADLITVDFTALDSVVVDLGHGHAHLSLGVGVPSRRDPDFRTLRGGSLRADPLEREGLRALLDVGGIDPGAYSLQDGQRSEAYVLDRRGDRWVIYYSERGLESGLIVFPSEAAAARHLRGQLRRHLTTRT